MFRSAMAWMLPPRPPSPPSGPPRGTNFSRRKLMQPPPPWPASTRMSTSSTNMQLVVSLVVSLQSGIGRGLTTIDCRLTTLFNWQDADLAAARAVIFKPDAAGDFRENRIVFAEAGVQARFEAASPLAHDNRAAG